MKYYINLIKRKRIQEIISIIAITIFGIMCLYSNVNKCIQSSMYNKGGLLVQIANNTNVGIIILGLISIYVGLIIIPVVSPYSQDDSDYEVKSLEEEIYVKHKDREFLINRKNNGPTFRDKNGKFIGLARAYQIYSYLEHNNLIDKQIDENKKIKHEEIISKFYGMRQISEEEKQIFIKQKKLKNNNSKFSTALSVLFWLISLVMLKESLSALINNKIVQGIVLIIIFVIGFAMVGMAIYKAGKQDDILVKKILNGKMYVADCYSYDKKMTSPDGPTDYYFIKVTDNNGHYIDEWLEIPYQEYKNLQDGGILKAKLFVLEDKPENQLFVVTNYEEVK